MLSADMFDFQKQIIERSINMWTVIIIIFVLWLLGAFGGNVIPNFPKTGNWVHSLIVIAIILLILKVLNII